MVRLSPGGLRSTAHTAAPATWWFALLLVLTELVCAAGGIDSLGLAAAALIAPGFALSGLLPRALRSVPVARAAAAPSLGLAATSLVLITIAKLGVPLTEVSVRVVVVGLLVAGLLVPRDEDERERGAARGDETRAAARGAARGDEKRATARGDSEAVGNDSRHASGLTRPSVLWDAVALATVLVVAVALGWQVIGTLPVPGDDWAKYLLYADEIRRQGSLLLDNTLWMGGRPFSEDPGVPSLEGAALLMTGAPAGGLVHVILFLMLAQIAAAFAAARAFFGLPGAIVTAGLMAIVPASQNILGWHGLANVGALAILAVVLAQLGAWLADELDRRAEVGLAITLIGVAAAHRLTAVFMVGTLGLVILAALCTPQRRALALVAARTLGITIVLGFVVVLDLQVRAGQSGGTLPYTSYLGTKVDLSLALRDITPLLALGALATVFVLGVRQRALPRAVWPALGLATTSILLTYAWVLHLPLYYSRTVFFLPLALAPLAGAGAGPLLAWVRSRRGARTEAQAEGEAGTEGGPGAAASTGTEAEAGRPGAGAGTQAGAERGPGAGAGRRRRFPAAVVPIAAFLTIAAVVSTITLSWLQADKVRDYYGFASPTALRGLDQLAPNLAPNEIVATDRCWSFLATWLLHTRTYPALEEQDIQPKAELLVARKAAAIMRGSAEGRTVMRSEGIRWALLDPTCPVSGDRFLPPGKVRFASKRLAIVELDPNGKTRKFPKIVTPRRVGRGAAEPTPVPTRTSAPENALP